MIGKSGGLIIVLIVIEKKGCIMMNLNIDNLLKQQGGNIYGKKNY